MIFQLRLQEYVALIKDDQIAGALAFAKKHLQPLAGTQTPLLKRALALLVFRRHTQVHRYQELLADERWKQLSDLFMTDLLRCNNMPEISLFEAQMIVRRPILQPCQHLFDRVLLQITVQSALPQHTAPMLGTCIVLRIHDSASAEAIACGLQAGLIALKNPLAYEDTCTKRDPMHLPEMRRLAADLPWAKHATSRLICSIDGTPMDDNNPPMVLPNGYAYGRNALEQMAAENDGELTCPQTGEVHPFSSLRRAYIM